MWFGLPVGPLQVMSTESKLLRRWSVEVCKHIDGKVPQESVSNDNPKDYHYILSKTQRGLLCQDRPKRQRICPRLYHLIHLVRAPRDADATEIIRFTVMSRQHPITTNEQQGHYNANAMLLDVLGEMKKMLLRTREHDPRMQIILSFAPGMNLTSA